MGINKLKNNGRLFGKGKYYAERTYRKPESVTPRGFRHTHPPCEWLGCELLSRVMLINPQTRDECFYCTDHAMIRYGHGWRSGRTF